MSKYRCPVCGAGHKEEATKCRLCGQSLAPDALAAATVPVAQPLHRARGIKSAVLIGMAVVLAILVASLAFGLVKPTSQIKAAKDVVTERADGWSTQVEEQGGFKVDLPDKRTRATLSSPLTDDGKLTAWTTDIGDDSTLVVGWGKVNPTTDGGALTPAAVISYLREVVAQRWMAEHQLAGAYVATMDDTLGPYPAIFVRSLGGRVQHKGKDGYAFAVFAASGTDLYVLSQETIYKEPTQLQRMGLSFVVTGPPRA